MLVVQTIGGLVGATLTSFAFSVGSRAVNGLSLLDRSRCVDCRRTIRWFYLIPVAGFFLSRGTCQYCRARIPVRYPVVEAVAVLFFVVVLAQNGWTFRSLKLYGLFLVLVSCAESDLNTKKIPNRILLGALIAIVGIDLFASLSGAADTLNYPIAAFGLVAGLLLRSIGTIFFGTPGLGFGDIKLLGIIGVYSGSLLWGSLIVAIVTAATFGLIGIFSRRIDRQARVPFAPFLATGFVIACAGGGVPWM